MIRIDAHQHFWSVARADYDWLTPALPRLYRDFLPEHLAPLLTRSGIDHTVVVQAAETEAETDFLLELAATTPFVAGVIGWTDLESRAAPMRIETLARTPALRGVRPMLQDLADDEWMLRPSIAPAIAALCRARLRFDALVRPRHLAALRRFVARYPDLPVVIDHGAKPAIAADGIDVWAAQMRAIARDSRVVCKLSGLATEASRQWSAKTLAPYVDVLLEAFGPQRLMWGSDWPVLLEAFDASAAENAYAAWLDAASILTSRLSRDDRDWIFGKTAATFYGIERPQAAATRAIRGDPR